jgi:nicotinamidase-related amidase
MVFFDTSTYVKNGKFASDNPKEAAMVRNWQAMLGLARELKMMIAWPQTAQRPDGAAYFPRRQDIGDDGKPLPIGTRRPISNNVLGAPHIRTIEDIATGPRDYIFGIASTAYGAHRLDFDLVIVSDGCYPGLEPSEHDVFMKEIFPGIGRVRTADQVMAMLKER